MEETRKKRRWLRWLFWLGLPLTLLGKAWYSVYRAFKGSQERLAAPDRELPPTAPYSRHRRVVQTGGGVAVTATVFMPTGEGPFPCIIMVHSWGLWRLQCDFLYAPMFARRGYVVVTYDCRGWGSSGGEVECVAPTGEMCDLEDMITWMLSDEANIPIDPERIGITGVSYGGGHSFLISTRDERIKAAAPMNGWTDLYQSLMPGGCWKITWSLTLLISSVWAMKFNPRNELMQWLKAVVLERNLHAVKEELEQRSAIHYVDQVKCPMFIVHSWNDDLFEPNQILNFYDKLDVPKKLWISNGLHGMDPGRGDLLFPNDIWDAARRWFDYWLKDDKDNGIADEPAVKYYRPWSREMVTSEQWPPEGVEDKTFYLRGEHESTINGGRLQAEAPVNHEPAELLVNNTVTNLQSSGPSIVRLNVLANLPVPGVPISIPGDSVAFTTEPLDGEAIMEGTPKVAFSVSSSTNECQLNALLYDVSPRGFCRLVTHGCAMRVDINPSVVEEMEFELIACSHRFAPGHRVRVVVCAADPLWVFPSVVPSYYRLFHRADHPSSIALPLMQPGAL